tara:strand:+ start:178 stop:297 length:120 start_codon:yes stop_codon:yes gene_type:complete
MSKKYYECLFKDDNQEFSLIHHEKALRNYGCFQKTKREG